MEHSTSSNSSNGSTTAQIDGPKPMQTNNPYYRHRQPAIDQPGEGMEWELVRRSSQWSEPGSPSVAVQPGHPQQNMRRTFPEFVPKSEYPPPSAFVHPRGNGREQEMGDSFYEELGIPRPSENPAYLSYVEFVRRTAGSNDWQFNGFTESRQPEPEYAPRRNQSSQNGNYYGRITGGNRARQLNGNVGSMGGDSPANYYNYIHAGDDCRQGNGNMSPEAAGDFWTAKSS